MTAVHAPTFVASLPLNGMNEKSPSTDDCGSPQEPPTYQAQHSNDGQSSDADAKTMTTTTAPRGRPVFFVAALGRALRQPMRRRIRSLSTIGSFACEALYWALTKGVPYAIPTLLSSREAIIIPLPNRPNVSLHVYPSPAEDTATLPALLSALVPPSPQLASRLSRPVSLVVHGGAWGSGTALQYSKLATSLRDRTQTSVVVLSYPVYPNANVDQQVDAVDCATKHIRARVYDTPFILFAHSSGAHITALSLLRNAMEGNNCKGVHARARWRNSLPDTVLLLAGVFHLGHHFLFEARRGIAQVSPMQPAAEADECIENFIRLSPSNIAETMETRLCDTSSVDFEPRTGDRNNGQRGDEAFDKKEKGHAMLTFLEGDIAAHNIPLPPVGSKTCDQTDDQCRGDRVPNFPKVFLLASSADIIVPIYSSIRFAASLRRAGAANARLLVYDGVGHTEFITHWFDECADLSNILDNATKDEVQRAECVRLMHGTAASNLLSRAEQQRAGTAHMRDILRIYESFGMHS